MSTPFSSSSDAADSYGDGWSGFSRVRAAAMHVAGATATSTLDEEAIGLVADAWQHLTFARNICAEPDFDDHEAFALPTAAIGPGPHAVIELHRNDHSLLRRLSRLARHTAFVALRTGTSRDKTYLDDDGTLSVEAQTHIIEAVQAWPHLFAPADLRDGTRMPNHTLIDQVLDETTRLLGVDGHMAPRPDRIGRSASFLVHIVLTSIFGDDVCRALEWDRVEFVAACERYGLRQPIALNPTTRTQAAAREDDLLGDLARAADADMTLHDVVVPFGSLHSTVLAPHRLDKDCNTPFDWVEKIDAHLAAADPVETRLHHLLWTQTADWALAALRLPGENDSQIARRLGPAVKEAYGWFLPVAFEPGMALTVTGATGHLLAHLAGVDRAGHAQIGSGLEQQLQRVRWATVHVWLEEVRATAGVGNCDDHARKDAQSALVGMLQTWMTGWLLRGGTVGR